MVICKAGAAMVRLKGWDATALLLSVTLTVNANAPDDPAVPAIVPVEGLSDSPPGSEPEATDHEYGGVPPVAVNVCEYAAPVEPGGKADGDVI